MMELKETRISGVIVLQREVLEDNRGSFQRLFCDQELTPFMQGAKIVQMNHSRTLKRGTVRGLHLQLGKFSEKKIITCIKGKVFDVALDLRKDSKTFLDYFTIELSQDDDQSILLPEGVAHGFQSLQDNSELLYLHTSPFSKAHECGFHSLDPTFGIDWPLKVINLSERDEEFK